MFVWVPETIFLRGASYRSLSACCRIKAGGAITPQQESGGRIVIERELRGRSLVYIKEVLAIIYDCWEK